MNTPAQFEAEALRVLRSVRGLDVVLEEPTGADHGVDAVLRYGGNRAQVFVEVKQRANAATAWQLVQYAKVHPGRPILLIAGQTTGEARQILEEHGVALVDGLGNAHVELPGLLLHLQGRNRPNKAGASAATTRLRGKAGVAAQLLLLQPKRAWRVRELAIGAQISTGLAHRVLTRLQAEGIVTADGSGPNRIRHVTNQAALLDLWSEENVERPIRTLGFFLAQTPQELAKRLGQNLGLNKVEYALTGAAAGNLLAPLITSVPVVDVWVDATAAPRDLLDASGAQPVPNGQNVVFYQAKDNSPLTFREQVNGLWVVNRFRLYADLRRDPRRGREQADHLRREVIGF